MSMGDPSSGTPRDYDRFQAELALLEDRIYSGEMRIEDIGPAMTCTDHRRAAAILEDLVRVGAEEQDATHRAGQEAMRKRAAAACHARAERYAVQVEQREPGSGGRIVADARSAEAEACADAIKRLEVEW